MDHPDLTVSNYMDNSIGLKRVTSNDNDNIFQDQKVIDIEQQQLEKMQQDFEILFRTKIEENETLMVKYDKIEKENTELTMVFEQSESEMKDRWKREVDVIAQENSEIEEAWNDLQEQETLFTEQLRDEELSQEERENIEHNRQNLQEARTLLKLEEQKVASKERQVLDAIEKEMEEWENHKRQKQKEIEERKIDISKSCESPELDTLRQKIQEKETTITEFQADLVEQEKDMVEFEKYVEKEKVRLIEEKEQIQTEKNEINSVQCKDVIKFEKQIIEWNEELNSTDEKMNVELVEIQEERERYGPVNFAIREIENTR